MRRKHGRILEFACSFSICTNLFESLHQITNRRICSHLPALLCMYCVHVYTWKKLAWNGTCFSKLDYPIYFEFHLQYDLRYINIAIICSEIDVIMKHNIMTALYICADISLLILTQFWLYSQEIRCTYNLYTRVHTRNSIGMHLMYFYNK